ncbi:hypothetical protein [Xanthomonas oryzae]|uniref:hypothetical protein n=1 Tax=Xanthomonas oryzae TaxID=347 RepID=UPI001E5A518C|nr:hypothetical protein [Xanthomonas oryzae]
MLAAAVDGGQTQANSLSLVSGEGAQGVGAGQRHRIALGLRRADPLLGRDRLHALGAWG